MAIWGLRKSCLAASQAHGHRSDHPVTGGSSFWLAWSGFKNISDILLFVLLRISRKFLWVFYVTEVGSTEKLYPPGWYFWKENSKLLGGGGSDQERKEWVRIKKVPSGKSHMENQIDGKWDFFHVAAFGSAGQRNKSSLCLRGGEKSVALVSVSTSLWNWTLANNSESHYKAVEFPFQ